MTLTEAQPADPTELASLPDPPSVREHSTPELPRGLDRAPISMRATVAMWVLISALGVVAVHLQLGPLSNQRDQGRLLEAYRVEIEAASQRAFGLGGVEAPTVAPSRGDPVGILDIERLDRRAVVIEGSAPSETLRAPGHVVGTAAPGQPGNSVVVGRRSLYGGAFGDIDRLRGGDRVLVSTAQGQVVYVVGHVGDHPVLADAQPTDAGLAVDPAAGIDGDELAAADVAGGLEEVDAAEVEATESLLSAGAVTVEELYGPSEDDRLTLISSASALPWDAGEATVVVATMDGLPFPPTPQGGRTTGDDGRSAEPNALASLILAVALYLAGVVGVIWLHRTLPWRSAYLLATPILIGVTIFLADQVAMVLPAWA